MPFAPPFVLLPAIPSRGLFFLSALFSAFLPGFPAGFSVTLLSAQEGSVSAFLTSPVFLSNNAVPASNEPKVVFLYLSGFPGIVFL